MYRILDPYTCPSLIQVALGEASAIVDREDIALAAMSRCGTLVYANRVFLNEFSLRGDEAQGVSLPDFLRGFRGAGKRPCRWILPWEGSQRVLDLVRPSEHDPVDSLILLYKPLKSTGFENFPGQIADDPTHPLFANAYCGLYVADPEAYTLKVNPSYEKIAFLPESELLGRNLRELEEKGYFSRSVTLRVLAALREGRPARITFFQKIITGKEVVVTGVPVFSENGRLAHIVTLVRDLINLETIARKCAEQVNRRQKFWSGTRLAERSNPPKPLTSFVSSPTPFPLMDRLPIIAKDPLMLAVIQQAVDASKYESPILLSGETGAGKDLMAKYIHMLSADKDAKPFVTVNCSAIPQELLESELFGYEEGAFSGAKRGGKKGLFEQAHGGTLFLNEISEMPIYLQTKLLTVLDEGMIRRLGGTRSRPVRVRIICATNSDLRVKIENGSFRSDLYYRIKVLAIHIPPLRQRPEDILPLIRHFTACFCRRDNMRRFFSPAVQELLVKYNWPGNVRELRNLVERLVVFTKTSEITMGDLPAEILEERVRHRANASLDGFPTTNLKSAVRSYERQLIRKALEKYGSFSAAAKQLGVDPTTLSRKLRRD